MVLLLYNSASAYLLVALSLSSCLRACGSTVSERVEILTAEDTTRPEVRIPHGTVRGINMVTCHGRNIFGFKRIPFARPPVGSLRFKGPVAAEPWNGTLDANNDSKPCPQMHGDAVIGEEDCLYLNVYTPKLPTSEKSMLLPVMVYVYGGGFKAGSTASTLWGPYYILEKDVILVVPSYRLGVLGFLSTGDEVSPGNYGLKDLVQALKWNRDNIQYFGGDPSQVTFVGGSSGAMAVELLSLSNLTNVLYKDTDILKDFLDKIDLILPAVLLYDSAVDNVKAYTAALKSHYLNDLTADKNLLSNNITQLVGDFVFNYSMHTEAQQRLIHTKSPHYMCSFEYRGTFSHSYKLTGDAKVDWGAVHGDETLYLFQQPSGLYGPPEYKMNKADWKMVDTMIDLWTSFIINGTPTTSDPNTTIIWEPYSSRKNLLQIGPNSNTSLAVKYNFFEDHLPFWEEVTASIS